MHSIRANNAENIQTDAVSIGAGGAGLAAAVAAAEKGAKVIVLEKLSKPGGNTARAQGFFAAESSTQKRNNIVAPRDVLFKMAMDYAHWKINPRIMRTLIDKSVDTVDWLEQKGMPQVNQIWPLFPGQEIPTMHYPEKGGAGVIETLINSCNKMGVRVMYHSQAKKITTTPGGAVSGVLATNNKNEIKIKAKCAIIATGGYGGNKEMLKKYCPAYIEGTHSPGLPHKGDGLLMATEAGAATEGLGMLMWLGPVYEGIEQGPGIWKEPDLVWVNNKGERFVDESVGLNHFESVNAVLRQPDRVSYSLFDEQVKCNMVQKIESGQVRFRGLSHSRRTSGQADFTTELQLEAEKGRTKISESWDAIAQWMGADPEVLKSTVEEYNDCCYHGYDKIFGKDRKFLLPLTTPPYYAMRCRAMFLATIGGIKINHNMEVLDSRDNPIPGLYAGGNDTGGWEPDTYNAFLSSHAMGFAINSGRIAGENAAQFLARK